MSEKVKEVYIKSELVSMGYPRRMLDELRYSDDFPEFGFVYGRTAYFNLEKLKAYLQEREERNDRRREGFRYSL